MTPEDSSSHPSLRFALAILTVAVAGGAAVWAAPLLSSPSTSSAPTSSATTVPDESAVQPSVPLESVTPSIVASPSDGCSVVTVVESPPTYQTPEQALAAITTENRRRAETAKDERERLTFDAIATGAEQATVRQEEAIRLGAGGEVTARFELQSLKDGWRIEEYTVEVPAEVCEALPPD